MGVQFPEKKRYVTLEWPLSQCFCGAQSARSMDRAAQSMDPYFAQESMDRAGICGSSCAIHEFCV